jgi:hypothetical protein
LNYWGKAKLSGKTLGDFNLTEDLRDRYGMQTQSRTSATAGDKKLGFAGNTRSIILFAVSGQNVGSRK